MTGTAFSWNHTGQPSVDPVVIFKVLLLGYLDGITSERRLAEEVRLHLGYRWFLGYDFDVSTPDQHDGLPRSADSRTVAGSAVVADNCNVPLAPTTAPVLRNPNALR